MSAIEKDKEMAERVFKWPSDYAQEILQEAIRRDELPRQARVISIYTHPDFSDDE